MRDLLASRADNICPLDGVQLAGAKVKHWFSMGGRYSADLDPARWGNCKMDLQATIEAVSRWPGRVTFTGGGPFAESLATGSRLSEPPADNPIRRV